MKNTFLFPLLATAALIVKAQQNDWIPYKDEIHIKTFSSLLTYDEAQTFCSRQGENGSLVMVKESDLQDLLTNYTQDIVDFIWLGGKYHNDSSEFLWRDGSLLTFTNWLEGFPRNVTDGDACMELRSVDAKLSNAHGKWAHASCRKRNVVMCQKRVPWSLEDAVHEIIKLRNQHEIEVLQLQMRLEETETRLEKAEARLEETEGRLEETGTRLEETKTRLEGVSTRVVPVGSIYIEYYNQPSPSTLWPDLRWQEISSTYAGLFFRAYGGSSAGWGNTQAECAPRISQMNYKPDRNVAFPYTVQLPTNGWSEFGRVGWDAAASGNYEGLQLYTQHCEVRPKNQAIRIWRRTS